MPLAGRSPRLHCSCLTAGGFHGNERARQEPWPLFSLSLGSGPHSSARKALGLCRCWGSGRGAWWGPPERPSPARLAVRGVQPLCLLAWGSRSSPGAHTWVCGGTGCLPPQRLSLNTKVPSGPRHCRQEERQLSPQAGCGVALGAGQASVHGAQAALRPPERNRSRKQTMRI